MGKKLQSFLMKNYDYIIGIKMQKKHEWLNLIERSYYFQPTFILIYIVKNDKVMRLVMNDSMKRTMTIQGEKVTILKVPWYPQSDTDWKCFVCSLKMCLEYFKNEYHNNEVRQNIPSLDIDNLMEITHTRKNTGTPVGGLCKKLQKAGLPFSFQLKSSSFNELEERIDAGLPVIVIYNGSYLKDERRGPSHAGVVIGINDDDIILNNPWFGATYKTDRFKFERAWELEYNQVLIMDPIDIQIQQSLEDA